MKKIKIYKDKELDTCWITLKQGVEDYREEVEVGFSLEFDKRGEVIGIEIQNFSRLSIFTPMGVGSKVNLPSGYFSDGLNEGKLNIVSRNDNVDISINVNQFS